MDKEKLYLAVANDEPYMPLRLHFSIKKKKVYDVFQALGSVDYDKEQKAFDWYYEVKAHFESIGFNECGKLIQLDIDRFLPFLKS